LYLLYNYIYFTGPISVYYRPFGFNSLILLDKIKIFRRIFRRKTKSKEKRPANERVFLLAKFQIRRAWWLYASFDLILCPDQPCRRFAGLVAPERSTNGHVSTFREYRLFARKNLTCTPLDNTAHLPAKI